MKNKNQPQNSRPRENEQNAGAFEALIGAIGECRAKPPYDYQRIIICYTNSPDLGRRVARRCGAARAEAASLLKAKRCRSVFIIDKADGGVEEALESIVCFVNQTRGVVVLLTNARKFSSWHDPLPGTAAKIRRRTHIKIRFGG
jgi:hypothetical protein